jgi:hypothetical protein
MALYLNGERGLPAFDHFFLVYIHLKAELYKILNLYNKKLATGLGESSYQSMRTDLDKLFEFLEI